MHPDHPSQLGPHRHFFLSSGTPDRESIDVTLVLSYFERVTVTMFGSGHPSWSTCGGGVRGGGKKRRRGSRAAGSQGGHAREFAEANAQGKPAAANDFTIEDDDS